MVSVVFGILGWIKVKQMKKVKDDLRGTYQDYLWRHIIYITIFAVLRIPPLIQSILELKAGRVCTNQDSFDPLCITKDICRISNGGILTLIWLSEDYFSRGIKAMLQFKSSK